MNFKFQLFHYLLFLILAVFALQSCSSRNPEEQLHELIEKAEESGENKSLSGIKKLIAKDYSDDKGLTKDDLLRICAGFFFRNRNIFIQTRIENIQYSENGENAHLAVIAAISDRNIEGDNPELLKSDFHRFDVELSYDGDWQVNSLQWKRVTVNDFLNI